MDCGCRVITGLILGCVALLCSGGVLMFSEYKNALRARMGFDEPSVDLMASLANLGICMGTPAGLLLEKFGYRATGLAALFGSCIPLGLLWAFTGPLADQLHGCVWPFHILFFMFGFGEMHAYMLAFGLNISNFPEKHHGKLIGVLDSCFSAGSGLFTVIFASLFHRDTPSGTHDNLAGFFMFSLAVNAVVFVLCVLLLGNPPANDSQHGSTANDSLRDEHRGLLDDDDDISQSVVASANNVEDENSGADYLDIVTNEESGVSLFAEMPFSERSLTEVLCLASFQFVMWQAVFASAVELVYMENISTYLKSLYLESSTSAITTTHFAIQAVSKLGIGFVSDLICHRVPRAVLYLHAYAAMAITYLVYVYDGMSKSTNFVLTIVVAHAYGATWCQSPTIVSDLFGAKHFPSIWGFVLIICGVGGLGFNTLFGEIYKMETHRMDPDRTVVVDTQDGGVETTKSLLITTPNGVNGTLKAIEEPPGGEYCYGLHCFEKTSMSLMIFSGLALLFAICLVFRQLTFRRLRERSRALGTAPSRHHHQHRILATSEVGETEVIS